MDLATFNQKMQDVLANASDQGTITNLLAEMNTGFSEEIAARAAAEDRAKKLEEKNKKLKEDNMNLFLRVTVPPNGVDPVTGVQVQNQNVDPVQKLYGDDGRLHLTK